MAAQAGVRVLLHDAIEGMAAQAVVDIHDALQASVQLLSGDPRYRLSPWLRRRADLGLSLLHASAA